MGELSLCFIDTVTDPMLLLGALSAGLHQRNGGSVFQILLSLISLSHFLLAVLGYKTEVTGVMVHTLVTSITCWTISTILTSLERYRQLPISARHGHGAVLLIFCTVAFMQVT